MRNKVFLALLISLFVCGSAFAVVRPTISTVYVDGLVTTVDTILVDLNVYFTGATVGDKIELRKGSSTGTIFFTGVAATANGNMPFVPSEPIMIDGGIYVDVTRTTGAMGISLIYQK